MKKVPAVHLVESDEDPAVPVLPLEVRVAMADIAETARQGLLAMSVAVGMRVMTEMMEAEVDHVVGPKGKWNPERQANRHGDGKGSVVLGGRRVPVSRPRARRIDGGEMELETYETFGSEDLLTQVVMQRMLAGLATRRHRAAAEPVGEEVERVARSTSRSAVSRRFIAGTAKILDELMRRDLCELSVAAMMIDGVVVAETCCVVALAICADGTKVPVGLWEGDTENKRVVTDLLADLVSRGLDQSRGLLFVLDGAKALAAGVKKVFGADALIQRCTLHKRRNAADYLPDEAKGWVDTKLKRAFYNPDPVAGLRTAKELASLLEDKHPGAAASIREGLEEMFTVRRLGLGDRLAATLMTTNPVESMISVVRDTTRNVKRWRGGQMVRRWTAAGMLNAERSFRRIKGCKDMPGLVAALARHVEGKEMLVEPKLSA